MDFLSILLIGVVAAGVLIYSTSQLEEPVQPVQEEPIKNKPVAEVIELNQTNELNETDQIKKNRELALKEFRQDYENSIQEDEEEIEMVDLEEFQ